MSPEEAANTIILTETGEKNLRIETVEAGESDFEETIFALGRIQAIPERRAVVASRIPGRVVELKTALGAVVQPGADVLRLESRQPGDPPPSIWLKAPAGGLVTETAARIGEPVDPDKALLEITDLAEVHAVARVPEHFAARLKPGAAAHITVSAVAGAKLEGTLLRFGNAVNKESGTLDAIFSLANPALALRPEMRAEFSIVTGKREGVMSIPRIALQGDAANRAIYRRHYDASLKHTFVRVPVVVGAMNDSIVEITAGLTAGDEVVTTGAYSLAFAGKGSVSLKEALDAAHGHPHNEDGSEMTAEQQAAAKAGGAEAAHSHAGGFTMWTTFFAATTGLLFVLLVIVTLRKTREAQP